MPLLHSSSDSAFKQNLHTLFHEVGKSTHVKSRDQALAFAYAVKRRGKAMGGGMMGPPMMAAPGAGAPGLMPQAGIAGAMPAPVAPMRPAMAAPANPAMRRPGFAFGGGPAPWQLRSEARNMMHSGPIMSAVPGRTDRHNMNLAAGSYVIPSQAVSHLGQNNTMAGMKVLNGMFGAGGPYGSSAMKIAHGPGAPKPPRPFNPTNPKFAAGGAYDAGGARGEGGDNPVEVVTAGGEYILTPEQCAAIGGGDVQHGHDILDAWVNKIKQDHIKTLQKLPGPAKS